MYTTPQIRTISFDERQVPAVADEPRDALRHGHVL